MNEDFVTYELTVKLEEKGFQYECLTTFDGIGYTTHLYPTIPQVLKWLREEKKLNVNMRLYIEDKWYYTIQNNKGDFVYSQLVGSDVLYESYEESAIKGIEYALNNLI